MKRMCGQTCLRESQKCINKYKITEWVITQNFYFIVISGPYRHCFVSRNQTFDDNQNKSEFMYRFKTIKTLICI